jgi:hypothetical protein
MAKYSFLNLNPLGELEEDCVTRAIALVLCEDYYAIKRKLELVAELFECEKLCVCCYKFLLDEVYKLERIEEYAGVTIKEFAKHHKQGVYLIRVDNHLTALVNDTLYDIWDARDEIVRIVWVIK